VQILPHGCVRPDPALSKVHSPACEVRDQATCAAPYFFGRDEGGTKPLAR
jgi:hypothetical protein